MQVFTNARAPWLHRARRLSSLGTSSSVAQGLSGDSRRVCLLLSQQLWAGTTGRWKQPDVTPHTLQCLGLVPTPHHIPHSAKLSYENVQVTAFPREACTKAGTLF